MKSLRDFFHALGKIFRRFSRFEKTITITLAIFMVAMIVKLLASFVLELSLESGGIYGEGLVGKPRLINPVFVEFNDVDRDIASLIFSGLMKYDPVVQNFIPDLAESINRSPDNLTYFIKVKKNILWHDEKPFTADDVFFTYREVIQDPGLKNPFLHQAFSDIKIEKINEDTIAFTLPEANSFFVSFLTTGILPAHILRETPIAELEKNSFNKNPIGTGLFQFSQSQEPIDNTTSSLTLVRFDQYYGEQPKLKAIRFSFFDTWEDLMDEKDTLNGIPKIASHDMKTKITDERLALFPYQLPQYVAVFFQLEHSFVSDKKFRQVLMKSIQKEKLQELLNGEVSPVDTPYLKRFPQLWIHQYDVKSAAAILNDFGFRRGEDGFLRTAKDEIVTLTLLARSLPDSPQDEVMEKVANFLRDQWQAMGIRVNVRREGAENFSLLLKKREYDMVLIGQNLGYNNDSFAFWHSSKRGENGLNLSQLRSFRVDSILGDLRRIFDSGRKKARLADLEQALSDETPALFLYTPLYSFALDRTVTGFTPPAQYAFPGDRFTHIAQVSLAK